MEKKRYTFWVEENLWNAFQEYCDTNGFQKNLVLQHLLEEYMENLSEENNCN